MDITIRRATEADWPAFAHVDSRNFGFRYTEQDLADARLILDVERFFLALDGADVVGLTGDYQLDMTVPGGSLPGRRRDVGVGEHDAPPPGRPHRDAPRAAPLVPRRGLRRRDPRRVRERDLRPVRLRRGHRDSAARDRPAHRPGPPGRPRERAGADDRGRRRPERCCRGCTTAGAAPRRVPWGATRAGGTSCSSTASTAGTVSARCSTRCTRTASSPTACGTSSTRASRPTRSRSSTCSPSPRARTPTSGASCCRWTWWGRSAPGTRRRAIHCPSCSTSRARPGRPTSATTCGSGCSTCPRRSRPAPTRSTAGWCWRSTTASSTGVGASCSTGDRPARRACPPIVHPTSSWASPPSARSTSAATRPGRWPRPGLVDERTDGALQRAGLMFGTDRPAHCGTHF